jgi:serine/threonine-protein phosphatase 2A regulatory subunit A
MTDTKSEPSSSSLYPIAVLIDELRAEEQKKRVSAIKSLNTICVALGAERTRNELLPYILELLEDDEEVLCALADVLGDQLDSVGGAAQADHLFKVLERLCGIEEISVREKVSLPKSTLKLRLTCRRQRV